MRYRQMKIFGVPETSLFGICLFMFMMQPWMPEIYSIPIQVLLIWFLFCWAGLFRCQSLIKAFSIFSPIQLKSIVLLASLIFLRSSLDGWNMLRFAQFLTGIMISLLGCMAFQSSHQKKIILFLLGAGAVLSSMVAILQFFDFAPSLWQKSRYAGLGYVYGSTGFETTPVSYSYSILGIGMTLAGALYINWRYRIRLFPVTFFTALTITAIILSGFIFSNSRSGMLGIVAGLLVIMQGGKSIQRYRIRLIATNRRGAHPNFTAPAKLPFRILCAHAASILIIIFLSVYILNIHDQPVYQDARIFTTFRTYIPLILAHPIGLTNGNELIRNFEDAGSSYELMMAKTGGTIIAPHNFLLTIGVRYGPFAAIAFLILYTNAFMRAISAFRRACNTGYILEPFWILLLISANVAILIHSCFHNANIAMGEMRNWMWLGMLLQSHKILPLVHK